MGQYTQKILNCFGLDEDALAASGTIDPDKLWAEGGSTKGSGRGLGLSGYQRILEEYPNAASSTNWAEGVFVQELSMGGRR